MRHSGGRKEALVRVRHGVNLVKTDDEDGLYCGPGCGGPINKREVAIRIEGHIIRIFK